MITFTEKEIQDAFDNSSEIMKKLLLEPWVIEDTTLLGKKYNLRMDKVDILNKFISYIMLNLIPVSRLSEYIQKEISLSPEITENLIKDLDQKIFKKIKQEVIEFKNNSSNSTIESIFEKKEENKKQDKTESIKDYKDMIENNISTDNQIKEEQKKIDPYRTLID